MAKPWETPQWKKKRLEFIQGKTCEWCGSAENLAIHHVEHFNGLQEYKKLVTRTISQHFAAGKNKDEKLDLLAEVNQKVQVRHNNLCPKCGYQVYARKTISPKYKCKKCSTEIDTPVRRLSPDTQKALRREFRKSFLQSHKDAIDKTFKELKENSNQEYLDFKNVNVLCRKCHYAKEKGLVICEVCHKSYHKPKYGKCWECFKKTTDGKTVAQSSEFSPYINPWCGKTFQIKRKLWAIEANPKACCIAYCKNDPESCIKAKSNWS
jgi:ribosomal protein L37AE/L43A